MQEFIISVSDLNFWQVHLHMKKKCRCRFLMKFRSSMSISFLKYIFLHQFFLYFYEFEKSKSMNIFSVSITIIIFGTDFYQFYCREFCIDVILKSWYFENVSIEKLQHWWKKFGNFSIFFYFSNNEWYFFIFLLCRAFSYIWDVKMYNESAGDFWWH